MISTPIRPVYGQKCPIHADSNEPIYAFYIGRNPVNTAPELSLNKPEGHTFVRLAGNKLEVYCTRTEHETFPNSPNGIGAERVDIALPAHERNFLISRINKWEGGKSA